MDHELEGYSERPVPCENSYPHRYQPAQGKELVVSCRELTFTYPSRKGNLGRVRPGEDGIEIDREFVLRNVYLFILSTLSPPGSVYFLHLSRPSMLLGRCGNRAPQKRLQDGMAGRTHCFGALGWPNCIFISPSGMFGSGAALYLSEENQVFRHYRFC